MKFKTLVLLFAFLVCGLNSLFGAKGYEVELQDNRLSYEIGTHKISTQVEDGVTYSTIEFDGNIVTTQKGFAELPYVHASVMLENNNDVDIKVVGGEYDEYTLEYPLLPSRGVIYRNQDPNSIPFEISSDSMKDQFFPQNVATSIEPYILRDVRGVNVYAHPFQYNGATQTLRVYKNIEIELVENGNSTNPLERKSSTITREMNSLYQSMFVNYDAKDLTIGEYGDIHVIYTARDEAAIQPYIEWKKQKGYKVTSEVVATGTNVKDNVQNAYAANADLMYVQLVGDWADIKCDLGGGANAPMDPMLGCVVGSDNFPDIVVGRFSANSPEDVTAQVNKTIAYEQDNDTTADWQHNGLGIASNEGAGSGDDGEADNQHMDVIKNDKLTPYGYTTVESQYAPGASASQIGNIVNAGVSAINYVGHGSHDTWVTSGFSTANAAALTNGGKLPYIVSVACVNGEFHNGGDCFAEGWSRNPNGGSIVFAGATINQPWQPPMRGQDYFNDIVIGGYDYNAHAGQSGINTTEGRVTFGSAFFNALVLMYTEANGGDDLETIQTWTIFGDASVDMRNMTPKAVTMSSNTILAGVPFSTTISAGGSAFEGALVAVSQGDNIYRAVTDASGNITLNHELTPGPATLVVTGKNLATINEEIVVASPDQPWVVVNSFSIVDNNNSEPDYGETVKISVELKNVGSVVSENATVTLTTESEFATINDGTATYTSINGNATQDITEAFEVEVAANVADQFAIPFTVAIVDDYTGKAEYTSNISLIANAPVIEISHTQDIALPETGQTVNYTYTIENTGHAAVNECTVEISSDNSSMVTLTPENDSFDTIAAGESFDFEVAAAFETPNDDPVFFSFNLDFDAALNYTANYQHMQVCNDPLIISNDFATFPGEGWSTEGANWEAGDGNEAGGVAPEAKFNWNPGTVADQYLISPDINTNGLEGVKVRFKHMVNDYGGGYDLKLVGSNDGSDWQELMSFPAQSMDATADSVIVNGDNFTGFGSPNFKIAFLFSGDSYQINYWYIDDVMVFKHGGSVDVEEITPQVTSLHQNYPNPFNPTTTISFDLSTAANVKLSVFNAQGQMVQELVNSEMVSGSHAINFDAKALSSGVYYYKLATQNKVITKKMLLVK